MRRVRRPRVPVPTSAPRLRLAAVAVPPRPKSDCWHGGRSFTFLAETGDLDAIGWSGRGKSALWVYNLHYFDCLASVSCTKKEVADAIELMRYWACCCPPGMAAAWDPYPMSRRIVNWLRFALRCGGLPDDLLSSLAHQVAWLRQSLELDILGNHLFANAKALVFAGMCLADVQADEWLRTGSRLVRDQLTEQFLPDGAHFELSPMYHSIMLEDVLDLTALSQAYSDLELEALLLVRAERALDWLAAMCHPDGDISFFNDGSFGIASSPSELRTYARLIGVRVREEAPASQWLSSGYARLCRNDAVVLADIAPVGPDYQPGHAHADTLSFELSLGTQRVVVNAGTSVYGLGVEREAQRATRAHSTVEIDGVNSSDVWASFRVGARARARLLNFDEGNAMGEHDGYRSLPGRPIHRREWALTSTGLEVRDTIRGRKSLPAKSFFHLPAGVVARPDQDGIALALPDGRRVRVICTIPLSILDDCWFPQFGVSLLSQTLHAQWQSGKVSEITTSFQWGEQ